MPYYVLPSELVYHTIGPYMTGKSIEWHSRTIYVCNTDWEIALDMEGCHTLVVDAHTYFGLDAA